MSSPIPITLPMKHFLDTSPVIKKKVTTPNKTMKNTSLIKSYGGRSGPVVNLSGDLNDNDKALVLYVPPSPVSDMIGQLDGVKLRRTPPSIDSPQDSKRCRHEAKGQDGSTVKHGQKKNSTRKCNVQRTKSMLRHKLHFP